jgi:hypothetical protein
MATTYLNRSVTGNNNSVGKWTFSCWVKRTELGNTTHLFNFYTDNNNRGGLRFNSDDTILYYEQVSNTSAVSINTNAVFRDISAWYHIVLEVDKTISTPDTKIYVNGTLQTFQSDSDYTQNESTIVNSNTNLYINSEDGSANIRNQILTHIHYIDGTAYDASAFGETDATTGIWKPKLSPSVTYGTNGFFLKFNEGALGTDSSPNGNNFTVNGNLTPTKDTPENVFATFNPLARNASNTYSNGNTTYSYTNNYQKTGSSSLGMSDGKYYAEFKIGSPSQTVEFGIVADNFVSDGRTVTDTSASHTYDMREHTGTICLILEGSQDVYVDGSDSGIDVTFTATANDIIMIAFDATAKKIWFGKNGTWSNSGNPATNTNPTITYSGTGNAPFHFAVGTQNSRSVSANFGNGYFGTTAVSSATSDESGLGIFEYTVPSGYYALCTKNINEQEYD